MPSMTGRGVGSATGANVAYGPGGIDGQNRGARNGSTGSSIASVRWRAL